MVFLSANAVSFEFLSLWLLVIEILMKIATYSVVAVEIISIIPILSKVFLL